jgi:hypothetical protein
MSHFVKQSVSHGVSAVRFLATKRFNVKLFKTLTALDQAVVAFEEINSSWC